MSNQMVKPARGRRLWYLLLFLCFAATIWPSFYNRTQPELWGFPFFYWYQFLWIPLSGLFTGIVYLVTRTEDS